MKIQISLSNDILPSQDADTMSFWHGGNLDDISMRPQKKGRFEYGAGLYLITKYDIAYKYSKGNRKLYMVTVERGTDVKNIALDPNVAFGFLDKNIGRRYISDIKDILLKSIERVGYLRADSFNNTILNSGALTPAKTITLSNFLIENGADYELISNPFGWGAATMMVLYNTKKIKNIQRVFPKDKILVYDLPGKFL